MSGPNKYTGEGEEGDWMANMRRVNRNRLVLRNVAYEVG